MSLGWRWRHLDDLGVNKYITNTYPKNGNQIYSYLGSIRQNRITYPNKTSTGNNPTIGPDMKNIYENIKSNNNWKFIANEGSLENEPIFSNKGDNDYSPYFHMIMLREPKSWFISMYHFEKKIKKSNRVIPPRGSTRGQRQSNDFYILNLTNYLERYYWGTNEYFTRRICGLSCTMSPMVHIQHFIKAKTFLQYGFDLILILEEFTKYGNKIFNIKFPTFTFNIPTTNSIRQRQRQRRQKQRERQRQRHKKRKLYIIPQATKKQVATNKATTTNTGMMKMNMNINKSYNRNNVTLSEYELQYIQNHSWMDKVLYEYSKHILFVNQLQQMGI